MREMPSIGLPRYKHTQHDIGEDFLCIVHFEWCDFEKMKADKI